LNVNFQQCPPPFAPSAFFESKLTKINETNKCLLWRTKELFIYPTVQFKKKSISSFLGLSAYYSKLIGTRLKHREVVFLAIVPKTIVSVDISHHIYVLVCFPLLKYYSLIQCHNKFKHKTLKCPGVI